jgi:hypothetical protein
MARKYLRRYDDPRWRLWDEFVTLRIKIGSIPGKQYPYPVYRHITLKLKAIPNNMPLN